MEFVKGGAREQGERVLISDSEAGQRADVALAKLFNISRSNMQNLFQGGLVTKNGRPVKANYRLAAGENLKVIFPEPEPLDALPECIKLDVIYEDNDLIVINKARGMVVHPAAGNYRGTLVNALLYHCESLSGINGVVRPGIVHRLDKDTSGIMVCAKNDSAHLSLSGQIENKTARRTYLAVVRGNVKSDGGIIETLIDRDKNDRKKMSVTSKSGRRAVSEYEVLERFGKYTVVRCTLHTGRTHQIRVHMEYLGHPLVGDPKYSPMKTPFSIKGQALHSHTMTFIHPSSGKELFFEAPLPEDMQKIITRLRLGQFN